MALNAMQCEFLRRIALLDRPACNAALSTVGCGSAQVTVGQGSQVLTGELIRRRRPPDNAPTFRSKTFTTNTKTKALSKKIFKTNLTGYSIFAFSTLRQVHYKLCIHYQYICVHTLCVYCY